MVVVVAYCVTHSPWPYRLLRASRTADGLKALADRLRLAPLPVPGEKHREKRAWEKDMLGSIGRRTGSFGVAFTILAHVEVLWQLEAASATYLDPQVCLATRRPERHHGFSSYYQHFDWQQLNRCPENLPGQICQAVKITKDLEQLCFGIVDIFSLVVLVIL